MCPNTTVRRKERGGLAGLGKNKVSEPHGESPICHFRRLNLTSSEIQRRQTGNVSSSFEKKIEKRSSGLEVSCTLGWLA